MKKIFVAMFFMLAAVAFPLSAQKNATYQLSTHILDINRGVPASDVAIELYSLQKGEWVKIDEGRTDNNGRIGNFLPLDPRQVAFHPFGGWCADVVVVILITCFEVNSLV